MKRILFSVGLVAALWLATLVVLRVLFPSGLRPSVQVALIGVLWLMALVVYFLQFNLEGLMRDYVVAAAVTLAAAALYVGIVAKVFFVPPITDTPDTGSVPAWILLASGPAVASSRPDRRAEES